MNNNVNEQEILLRKKIEKREKTDIILAYILIIVLVGCIGIILYLKFIKKEDTTTPSEYLPNYISLSEISTSLNTSTLANRYVNDGATLTSMVSGNSIVINYTKDDNIVNLNVPTIGSELEFTISDDNSDIVTDIYKEVTNIVCVYYGNTETSCRKTINNLSDSSSINGIRFGDNNTVYVTITKSIEVSNEVVYNTVTKTNINDSNYILNLSDIRINGINVLKNDEGLTFSGNIEKLTDEEFTFSVNVKLYDNSGNILSENSLEYVGEDSLKEKNNFVIGFILDLDVVENVSEYSIEIIR